MDFGYFWMQGRQGITGYGKVSGAKKEITLRGGAPGERCTLYVFRDGAAKQCDEKTVDGSGQAVLTAPRDGTAFVVTGGKVRLWEDGEEGYLRANAWLAAQSRPQKELAELKPKEQTPAEKEPIMSEEAMRPAHEKEAISQAAMNLERTPEENDPPPAEDYTLRPAGEGEAVDGLPDLIWPDAAREYKVYFDSLPPCAPFYAPGWRFVRAPAAGSTFPFCAAGYRARDNRVTELAFAYPVLGRTRSPILPGCRFQRGQDGYDYWVRRETV